MPSKREVIEDVEQYLRHMKETGTDKLACDPSVLDAAPAPRRQNGPRTESNASTQVVVDRDAALAQIAARIDNCRDCPLGETRSKTVPGTGCLDPDIMFIGEGPGREEDQQGVPFVGRSGALLDRLIKRMGYSRDHVFIGNIVKCRATEDYRMKKDRAPSSEEMEACIHYLADQIAVVRPKVIVTLGNTAMEGLFGFRGITKRRGTWLEYEGIPAMPTYHPSFLLRGGGDQGKRFWEVWEDMIKVFEQLGKQLPEQD